MADNFIQVFRAYSGSQVVYFDSTETPPPGISERVVIAERFNLGVVSGTVGSRLLWKWNGQDTSQFDLVPVQVQGKSASLNIITSSFSPTSKSLQILGDTNPAALADHVVFLATSSLPTTNYIIEIGIRDIGPGAGGSGNAQGGPVFLAFGSGSTFHGASCMAQSNGNNLSLALWQTGSIDDSLNSVGGGSNEPTFMQIEVRGNRPVGSTFSFSAIHRTYGDTNEGARTFKNSDWAGSNPLISTWATSSINRFGLVLRGSTSSTVNEMIIDFFLIRSHPYLA